jgi:hypothetical protein
MNRQVRWVTTKIYISITAVNAGGVLSITQVTVRAAVVVVPLQASFAVHVRV